MPYFVRPPGSAGSLTRPASIPTTKVKAASKKLIRRPPETSHALALASAIGTTRRLYDNGDGLAQSRRGDDIQCRAVRGREVALVKFVGRLQREVKVVRTRWGIGR